MQVVERIVAYEAKGQWDDADTLIDYRTKGAALVPDLWEAGSQSDRAGLVDMLRAMFRERSKEILVNPRLQSGTVWTEVRSGPDEVFVEVRAAPGEPDLAVYYWLRRAERGWVVFDRHLKLGASHYTPEKNVEVIRRKIAGSIGHPPDLAEFVANAPTWVGIVKVRRIKITDDMMKATPSPATP